MRTKYHKKVDQCNEIKENIINLLNDYFRYSDYYSYKMSITEMVEYFKNNCFDKVNDRLTGFKIYLFAREIKNIFVLLLELNDFNEFIELFSKEELYELRIIVDMLKEICLNKQLNEQDNLFEFLESENEFKILFDGFGSSKALDNPFLKEAVRLFGLQLPKIDLVLFNNGLPLFK